MNGLFSGGCNRLQYFLLDGVIMDKKFFFNGRRRNGFTFLMEEWNFNGKRNFLWTESVLDWENF